MDRACERHQRRHHVYAVLTIDHSRRLLGLLAALVFVDTFGYAIVLPLMPLAASRRGAGPIAVGILFATYSGLQLISAPFLGRISDRYGRRPVLLASLIGSAAGFALMLVAGYWPLLASRIIDGATAGNVSVANAIVLDRFPRADWGGRFTMLSSMTGLGIVGGVAVSAGLARFGLSAAALAALGLSLATAVILFLLLPETSPRERATTKWRFPALNVQVAIPSGLAATALQSAFLLTLPLYLYRLLGWRETQGTTAIAVLIGIAAAFQVAVVGRIMRRVGARATALYGFALLAVAGLALSAAGGVALVLTAATIAALGVALLSPAVPTLISSQNQALKEGEVMGINQSVASTGQMAGPLLGYGALLFAPAGYGIVCAVLAAGGLALTYQIRNR